MLKILLISSKNKKVQGFFADYHMTRGTADRETVKLLHIVGPFFF